MSHRNSPLFLHLQQRERKTATRQLTEEESSEIKYAFEKLSGNQHVVTTRQLKIALRAMGFPVKKTDVRQILRDNGYPEDAVLDVEAFHEVVASKMTERSPNDNIKRAFQLFDLNSTGHITANDLKLIAKQLQCDIESAEIQDMIDEFDRDGDSAINEAEFKAIMSAYED
eukprot:jgi/Chrzof1/8383/Cz03g08160.t1